MGSHLHLPRKVFTLDTEFYEHPNAWGHAIEPISWALVSEDGDAYYAENELFSWNTMHHLASHGEDTPQWLIKNVQPELIGGEFLKHPRQVKEEVLDFVGAVTPEFWAYFASYDWVVFASLFGRMIDLPAHFPKYVMDIKQEVKRSQVAKQAGTGPKQTQGNHNALADAEHNMKVLRHIGVVP